MSSAALRPMPARFGFTLAVVGCALAGGCGYYYVAGPLQPTTAQAEEMIVDDDVGVTFVRDRLEVRLRPLTTDELDRQFPATDDEGTQRTNPYTFGDTDFQDGLEHQRFTVFHMKVKNYAYPRVQIDPTRVEMVAANGRRYWSLNRQQLETYFRGYITGFRGNEYQQYVTRMDVLRRTLFAPDPIFSGQELEGYLVFPALHVDVRDVRVVVHDAALRFDTRGEPVETVDLSYRFDRQVRQEDPQAAAR